VFSLFAIFHDFCAHFEHPCPQLSKSLEGSAREIQDSVFAAEGTSVVDAHHD